jgi:PIN domain nuclease of toxin-antitoxin system
MSDPANELWFSVVSHWEICIKISFGKLRLREGWEMEMDGAMTHCGIRWLGLKPEHSVKVVRLPFHHRDPFDRLLVAQAQIEDMTIVSRDAQIAAYSVPVVW